MAKPREKMTLIHCPLKPPRHLFAGRDSCRFMWEHLSHHVLRGDILSSSCCHVWVALGLLKAHFPQEEPAAILLPLARGTFFSPTSLLDAAETLVAIRCLVHPRGVLDPFLYPGTEQAGALGRASRPWHGAVV